MAVELAMEGLPGLIGGLCQAAAVPPVATAPTATSMSRKRRKLQRRSSQKRKSRSCSSISGSSSSQSSTAEAALSTAAIPERMALFFKRSALPPGSDTYRKLPLAAIKDILHAIQPETCARDDNTPLERVSISRERFTAGGCWAGDAETLGGGRAFPTLRNNK